MLRWWTTRAAGEEGEEQALRYLQTQGLRLEARNYRIGGGPRRPAAEIDLVMRERDGTLVFVEVRQRRKRTHGGAAASVSGAKQRRLIQAAQHYLMQHATPPPCRFDVVAIDGEQLSWLKAAFDAG